MGEQRAPSNLHSVESGVFGPKGFLEGIVLQTAENLPREVYMPFQSPIKKVPATTPC
jgi:hypothetical protein